MSAKYSWVSTCPAVGLSLGSRFKSLFSRSIAHGLAPGMTKLPCGGISGSSISFYLAKRIPSIQCMGVPNV